MVAVKLSDTDKDSLRDRPSADPEVEEVSVRVRDTVEVALELVDKVALSVMLMVIVAVPEVVLE